MSFRVISYLNDGREEEKDFEERKPRNKFPQTFLILSHPSSFYTSPQHEMMIQSKERNEKRQNDHLEYLLSSSLMMITLLATEPVH